MASAVLSNMVHSFVRLLPIPSPQGADGTIAPSTQRDTTQSGKYKHSSSSTQAMGAPTSNSETFDVRFEASHVDSKQQWNQNHEDQQRVGLEVKRASSGGDSTEKATLYFPFTDGSLVVLPYGMRGDDETQCDIVIEDEKEPSMAFDNEKQQQQERREEEEQRQLIALDMRMDDELRKLGL